jgi:hypothetical protein
MKTLTWKWLVASMVVATAAFAQTQQEIDRWNTDWATFQQLSAIPLAQRGMVQQSVDLPITINNQKTKKTFDIYSNVYNALGLHPFLVSITPIRVGHDTFDFLAYENIPLPDGTIFPSITTCRMHINRAQGFYEVDTYTAPGVITRQKITFQKTGPRSTFINERLVFETTPDFIGLATQGGVFAHVAIQQGLKTKIEAGQLQPVRFPRWVPGNCSDDENDDD